MLVVLIILYILFGISLIYYEVKDLKEKKKLDVFDFFRLYYFAFYCITPIASLIVLIKGNPDNLKPFRYLETDSLLFKYITLVIQIFVFVLIEYASKKFFNKKIQLKKRKNYVIDDTKPYFYIGNLLLIIFSWLALILYTAAYGSVFGIFKYAPYIRDNIFFVENKLTFLQPFTMILLITSFNCICLLKQMKNKSKRYKIITIIISLISFFGEGCVLISIDSRTRIVMTIIISMFIILYDKINQKNIKKIWKFTPIIVILYFFVLNLNTITSFIRNDHFGDEKFNYAPVTFIAKNYGYIYVNNLNILDRIIVKKNVDIRIDDNFIGLLVAFFPTRYKKVIFVDMHRYNTSFTKNANGQLPSDLITSSFYSLNFIGLITTPLFVAFILTIFKKLLERYKKLNNFYIMIFGYLGFSVCLGVSGFDLSCALFSNFEIIVSILALLIIKNKRFEKYVNIVYDKYIS